MRIIFAFVFVSLLVSCKSTKDISEEAVFAFDFEERLLDTLVVSAPRVIGESETSLPVYRASYKRINDLIHTKLDLSFDWEKEEVIGKAELSFQAIRPNEVLELHAQNFIIHEIKLNGNQIENYAYDDQIIEIPLGKTYKRGESFDLSVDYIARPSAGPQSGSAAITSDKGLFFINSDNKTPNKPQQIWTQGETEHNSRWFPTIDKPNERTTQEIYLTVEDRFKTLSNGKLLSSTKNNDGTRTDYWKQDLAHAPYLFMVAVGEFSITEENWRDKPLMYYVEPDYEASAKEIFNHTPEMLTFFSKILGYDYPWDKYAQLIARDYVSGAMENTTAVIFGEFVQKNKRELIDNHNDLIVAHEMIHHWFGDLVTCESWSNLTMNEGFANYGEYLWFEHKYGSDKAEAHRMSELDGYLYSASRFGTHDLIDFQYADKEDMFDAHSYNKGGLVLHMLRNYLGDETFFLGLKTYLHEHEYTAVEADDLRLAMEDVSGEDLNWFFNQWYFDQGHPSIKVSYDYNSNDGTVGIDIEQIQDPASNPAVFQLPLTAKLYYENGVVEDHLVWIDERKQSIKLTGIDQTPKAMVLDGDHVLLGEISETRPDADWVHLYKNSKSFEDRLSAVEALLNKASFSQIADVAIEDPYFTIRNLAMENCDDESKLMTMSLDDPHSSVRRNALTRLNLINHSAALALSRQIIDKDPAYPVITRAISILGESDIDEAIEVLIAESQIYERPYLGMMFHLMEKSQNPKYLDFFEDKISVIDVYSSNYFFEKYDAIAQLANPGRMIESGKILQNVSLDRTVPVFKRYLSTKSISGLIKNLNSRETGNESQLNKAKEALNKIINQIIEAEEDDDLRQRYESLLTE